MLKINAEQFASGAQLSQARWNLLVGRKVEHSQYGEGGVSEVLVKPDGNVLIWIVFQAESGPVEHCFTPIVCRDLAEIEFPDNLSEKTPLAVRPRSKFEVNDDVWVANNLHQRGRVSRVFQDLSGAWNYEVYLTAENRPIFRESDLSYYDPTTQWGGLNELLRDLAMAKLKKPMSDALYALYASRTKFEVYQFKPALKFLANPDQRLLIADEVGLGKTIEAGIIYLELQARLDLDRVLFVCPSSLKQKWQDEMKSRFDEDFVILDMPGIKNFIKQYQNIGDHTHLRGIVSLELIRRQEIAEQFSNIKFDMVMIDEAHHCRNSGTLANAIASTLVENSDAALLLTATPLQMGQTDLFNLLKILSPGEFDNFEVFSDRLQPNLFVNRAAEYLERGRIQEALAELKRVEQTSEKKRFLGNPYYQAIVHSLESDSLEKQELVQAQRRLLELNTLASIFTRTRKRDVQEKAPKRTAFTLTVNFSPEEEKFYNQVVEEVRSNYDRQHWSGVGSGWVTIMKERQAASCISAVIKKMHEEDQGHDQEETTFLEEFFAPRLLEQNEDIPGADTLVAVKSHPSRVVYKPTAMPDSKFEVFWDALKKVLADDPQSKILVFSFFVGTIEHVSSELRQRGVNVRAMHGGYKVVDRQKTIEEFRDDPSIRVLVSSDVGSEGLDFQFCDTLFNYDLPWNPMKVEQRIGRIDRFGQASDRIRIYNLVIENSIESRILYRLYDRIEIFKQSIGDIEIILGEQIRELTQAVFSNRLTEAEEIQRAEKAVTNILRQKQEMEEFEEKKLQFLGQEAILSTTVNRTIESGRFISDVEVRALVGGYIKEKFRLSRMESNGPQDATYTLFANDDLTQEIRTFIFGPKKNDRTAQQFLAKLIPGKEIPLTFSHDLAYQRKLLEFITPRHPLTQAALSYWREKNKENNWIYQVNLKTETAQPGKYYFFIFSLDTEGIDSDTRIIPIVLSAASGKKDELLSDQFLRLAQTGGMHDGLVAAKCDPKELNRLQETAFQNMIAIRDRLSAELAVSNEALVNARLAAVEQSYQAKQRHVMEILAKVTHASIQRMHQAQLRNMEAKKKVKVIEIEKGRQLHVTFTLQLRGFLNVDNGLQV